MWVGLDVTGMYGDLQDSGALGNSEITFQKPQFIDVAIRTFQDLTAEETHDAVYARLET